MMPAMKPKVGRPPRAKKPASIRVTIRLTGPESSRYDAAAKREGMSLGEWMRAAADLAYARGSTR
jgi:predicted HicB family RNase H-like nuclease